MNSSLKKPFASIALCAEADKPLYMLEVARILNKKYNSKIWLYCNDKDQLKYYKNIIDKDIIAEVTIMPSVSSGTDLHISLSKLSEKELIKKSIDKEKQIGTTISNLMLSNRHLGRGYAIAGSRHPRSSYSENTSYLESIEIYLTVLYFWEEEFEKKGITLILNGGKELAVLARAHKIFFRCITETKIDNLNFWGWNEYRNTPQIEYFYNYYNKNYEYKDITKTNVYTGLNKNKFFNEISLYKLPILIAERILRQIWWIIRRRQKSKGYYLSEMIKLLINRSYEWKILNKLVNTNIQELENINFVYYPLHVEPEVALQTMSPEFYFQHSIIASISSNLPAGYKLVVKEAFAAIGRRPPSFYRQIKDLKNVLIADPSEAGIEYATKANITITITGTAGFEAAVNGKPVITFGQHNNYNIMPNVHVIKNFNDISMLLKTLLDADEETKTSLLPGKKYIYALHNIAFDFSNYNFTDFSNFTSESVNDCIKKLEESILFELEI